MRNSRLPWGKRLLLQKDKVKQSWNFDSWNTL